MSSCMSGGGRACRLESLDLELIKSPSTSWVSNSSSPSSTLSESSNCPRAISTRKRKPRTPRKRPNQTYNEAAAILSTAYPKIFPTKHLSKTCKFTKSRVADDDDDVDNKNSALLFEPSDLLMPFDSSSGLILLEPPLLQKPPNFTIEPKGFINPCQSPGEINSSEEDFDAESMLDEEIGEGIDSIMGNLENESMEEDPTSSYYYSSPCTQMNNNNNNNKICSYGYPVLGLGFDQFFGYGMRRELRAMRNGDECDWWRFPSVNVLDLTPKIEKKKKKVSSTEINNSEENLAPKTPTTDGSTPQPNAGLLLKLNYDSVLNAWSDKGSPFSGDSQAGNDVQARLAQIDLFSENGGIREASVQRYKEKRRTRLFSKKIRYQVRKVNADRRPRMKGRFVRTPNSCDD